MGSLTIASSFYFLYNLILLGCLTYSSPKREKKKKRSCILKTDIKSNIYLGVCEYINPQICP